VFLQRKKRRVASAALPGRRIFGGGRRIYVKQAVPLSPRLVAGKASGKSVALREGYQVISQASSSQMKEQGTQGPLFKTPRQGQHFDLLDGQGRKRRAISKMHNHRRHIQGKGINHPIDDRRAGQPILNKEKGRECRRRLRTKERQPRLDRRSEVGSGTWCRVMQQARPKTGRRSLGGTNHAARTVGGVMDRTIRRRPGFYWEKGRQEKGYQAAQAKSAGRQSTTKREAKEKKTT